MPDQIRPSHFGIGKEVIVLLRTKHRNVPRERLRHELPARFVVDLVDETLGAWFLDGAAYSVLDTLEPFGNLAPDGLVGHTKVLREIAKQILCSECLEIVQVKSQLLDEKGQSSAAAPVDASGDIQIVGVEQSHDADSLILFLQQTRHLVGYRTTHAIATNMVGA